MSRVHDAMARASVRPPRAEPEVKLPPVSATPDGPPPAGHAALSAVGDAIQFETVLDRDADPILVDEFRKVASAVYQSQEAQDVKLLTVTSGAPDEGKSMTALNLALTLAASYNREVLLIDADFRGPSLAQRLDVEQAPGLTDLIAGPNGLPWPLRRATPRLSVMTAGQRTRDPISRISSVRLKQFLVEVREKFDIVIIDTPPVGPFPDAALLSGMCDATILVVSAGMASYKVAKKAVDILGEERILGVVLNRVAAAAFNETYGYYGRYRQKP